MTRVSSGAMLLSALVALLVCARPSARSSAASAPGPGSPDCATIRRDEYGVPHIIADSEGAAAFAHGYAAAEDHIELLARMILRARGELASVFGDAEVARDLRVRQLGIWDTARDQFPTLPPMTQGLLESYAAGYNLYREQHASTLPAWIAPITAIDLLAHCRGILLLDFALDLAPWNQPAVPKGSNMWAIGGARSASGHGLLLANPHVMWDRTPLYEVQLTVPGRINVAGATPVGLPVVTMGFNEVLGWTHTVNQIDADDVYELTLDPDAPDHYLYEGRSRALATQVISVPVKTAAGLATRTFTTYRSHYGPVISRTATKAYAYKSANLGPIDFLTEYEQMAKARTLAEFRSALEMQALPIFNVGYADRDGNVFYLFNGRIPVRPDGYAWRGIVPGNTDKTEWYAIYPIARLPQVINPPAGYIQNTNDPPWYATLPAALDRRAYPFVGGDDALGLRSQLSLRLLERAPKVGLEDIKQLKFDVANLLAERVKPDLLAALRAHAGDHPRLPEAIRLLEAWGNTNAADARGALLFSRWVQVYRDTTKHPFAHPWSAQAPTQTPAGLGDADTAVSAMTSTIDEFAKHGIALDARWGDVHRYRRGALDLPVGGDAQTFRVLWYRDQKDGKRVANGGDSYVLAVELGATPTAYSVNAISEASQAASAHHDDQGTLFANGAYKRLWFTEDEIAHHSERSYQPQRGTALAACGAVSAVTK